MGSSSSFRTPTMTKILIDGIGNISLHANLVRVECTAAGPDGKPQPSGTLLIPGVSAAHVMQLLINGLQELTKKLREQQQAAPTAGSA
jgi:hypothetical protein